MNTALWAAICAAWVPGILYAQASPPETSHQSWEAFSKQIKLSGHSITLPAGVYQAMGVPVTISREARFEISPAPLVNVHNEELKLSRDKPHAWITGTPLRQLRTVTINALGPLVRGSLVVRKSADSPPLTEGKDYLVDWDFGMLGIGPDTQLTPNDPVLASYQYSQMRVDSICVDAQGQAHLIAGGPHLTCPLPPAIPDGSVRLCNIFRPHHAQELSVDHLFPLIEPAEKVVTQTTPGRLPKAMAKLAQSRPLSIVCWGDSVTTGGDSSLASLKYVELFRRLLIDGQKDFCQPINVTNISYGGSASRQWLRMEPFTNEWFKQNSQPADQIDFDRVLALRPDVLTMEFVNDAYLDEAGVEATYGELLRRLEPLGTELVLITPHFTTPAWMGFKTLRETENRPYVRSLLAFAEKHHLAVADASACWGHLWKEGIPYPTLLRNTLNHPDDRGHAFFAEELIKCFR